MKFDFDLLPLHVKSVCHIAFYQPRPNSFLARGNTESIRGDPYWISRKNSLVLIELFSVNKVSLVLASCCSNTGSIRDDPYWTSRKKSLELMELSSINKVSLVQVSSCSNTRSISDDPY